MENICIRRINDSDAPAVSKLISRNFLEVNIKDYSRDEMEHLSETYSPDKVIEISRNAHMYIASTDDTVIGCGAISSFWGKQDESILLSFFVLPELHGKGIGRKIIETLENDEFFLRAKRIEISASITAYEFYKRMGYDDKDGIKKLTDEGLYRMEKFR
jgi:predicted N-acetyltransferase YhbS